MEIRVILDPNEVRELLLKTGQVVIKPTAENSIVDAREDRRGRPAANPPAVIKKAEKAPAEKAPAEKAPAEKAPETATEEKPKKAEKTKARTQVEVQTALAAHAKKHGREATLAVLTKYGKNTAEVKVEDYSALIAELSGETSETSDEW